MASGDLPNQVPIISGGFIKDSIIGGMPGPLSDSQQRHWVPDERDAFISWLRGEFAAANAIIDALCHHLQMIGKPGEYDFVLTCIQQRRYNWTVVLHMQQYFSVAEVVFALQQVVWLKQAINSDASGLPPFFGFTENDGVPPWKEGPNIYRDLRGECLAPGALGLQHSSVPEEQFVRKEKKEVSRKSEEQGDRIRSDLGDPERQQAVVSSSVNPVMSTERGNADPAEQPTTTLSRAQSDTSLSEASSILLSSQEITEAKSEKESNHGSHELADREASSSSKLENSEGDSSGKSSSPYFRISSKEEEDRRLANVKITKTYSCMELLDGKMVNTVDGLELHEKVLDKLESSLLATLIEEIRTAGKRGELGGGTFVSLKKGAKGKGRELLQFGHPHQSLEDYKKRASCKDDSVQAVPGFLEVIIDRLVRWHIIPASKKPDCCTVNIMEEGDYLPPQLDNSHLERPFCTLTLQSDCTVILGQSLTANSAGDFKGPLQISLSVGSVMVLQRNSADIARHSIPASPTKRISITFGKFLSTRPPRSYMSSQATSTASMPMTSWGPSFNQNTNNRQGNNSIPPHFSGRVGSGYAAPFKSHKYTPISSGGVLPNPTARAPAQIIPNITNSVPPLYSGTPGPPAGAAFSSPSAALASWGTPLPRAPPPNRPSSAGTGVFFPSGGASSGPGRPVSMAGQRRSSSIPSAPPLLQKTTSAPASFASFEAAAIASAASPSPPPGKSSKMNSITGGLEKVVQPAARVSSNVTAQNLNVTPGKMSIKEISSDLPSDVNGTKTGKEDNLVRSSERASRIIAGNNRVGAVSTDGYRETRQQN